ncbi:hypothetical protein [Luteolibacter marinus]|uniref:hypothetical protein n=1 Tax=Luteolibacter marinus TaxID=2776705 RepID=UPI00186818CC|nr:hypothetical protein [Luteolibacter marinus]
MSKKNPAVRILEQFLVVIASVVLLLFLSPFVFMSGAHLVIFHLLFGSVIFVCENLRAVSTDAGTWGPGLVAFIAGLGILHRFARAWAGRRGKVWTMGSTFCLGMVLPVVFGISFIVPGVLLQVNGLASIPWLYRDPSRPFPESFAQWLSIELSEAATNDQEGRFPDSLEDLPPETLERLRLLSLWNRDLSTVPEPLIYLGSGLTLDSAADLPLFISAVYRFRGRSVRTVCAVGGERFEIDDGDIDEWIDKAIAARSAAAGP